MELRLFNIISFIDMEIRNNQRLIDNDDVPDDLKNELYYYNKGFNFLKEDLLDSFMFNTDNIIFDILKNNYGNYDTKLIFYNGNPVDAEDNILIIDKDTVTSVEGDFIFIMDDEINNNYGGDYSPLRGFNIDMVKSIETIKK